MRRVIYQLDFWVYYTAHYLGLLRTYLVPRELPKKQRVIKILNAECLPRLINFVKAHHVILMDSGMETIMTSPFLFFFSLFAVHISKIHVRECKVLYIKVRGNLIVTVSICVFKILRDVYNQDFRILLKGRFYCK